MNSVGYPVNFHLGVFLSHNSKDKPNVHPLAGGLRKGGLRARLDEWGIKSGYNIPAKNEEDLHHSCVPALWMSTNAFGSDRAQLESGTFRFSDPLNKERRFLSLRLDDTPSTVTDFQAHRITLNNRIPPTISHRP